jgi:uncharacterized protein YdeI (YjbR/CyaY-like superfamily)
MKESGWVNARVGSAPSTGFTVETEQGRRQHSSLLKHALLANTKARENLRNLAPSHRRHYIGWIMHAAKDETRERRLREAVSLLEHNKKLGLK